MAAAKGAEVADIHARTYDAINGTWGQVAILSAYYSMSLDLRPPIAVGDACRYIDGAISRDILDSKSSRYALSDD